MTRIPRRHRRRTGFTLVELMFVVVLIGVLAAMVAPELNRARADAEVANAAAALVRLGSRARAHATYTGLAHALVWIPVNGTGSVQLFRGTSARCNSVPWAWNTPPIDQLNADQARYSQGVIMQLIPSPASPANIRLCIQPNGMTMLRTDDGVPFTESVAGVADVSFDIFHQRAGVRIGALRQVVFPNGNLPRWAQ